MTSLAVVLLKLSAIALPLLVLAGWLHVYPRRRLIAAAMIPAVLVFAVAFAPAAKWFVLAVDGFLVILAFADLFTLPRRNAISIERVVGRVASLRKKHPVVLFVMNHSRRKIIARLRDGVSQELETVPAEFVVEASPQSRSTFHYALQPTRRGAFKLEKTFVQTRSRLGFWRRLLAYPAETVVHVYPDMQQLSQYAMLARTNRLSLLGVRRVRRVGQDHEFERLRDYAIDDNHKHIDWRATARRRKLTVRDYQVTQSQRIIFLVDCGRMMTNEAAGVSLLDHAINAMLMLSYVALRQGDSVGMIAFSDEIHSFVPPRGGMMQTNRLLHASFNRFPRLTESRYDLAFHYLGTHCRKRSLVVLMTNVMDEVNAAQVDRYLTNLVGRHLPLGVLLRDHRLFEAAESFSISSATSIGTAMQSSSAAIKDIPVQDNAALWRSAAASDILAWRRQTIVDLRQKGVLLLDVFPESMTAPLVNRYLEIKARHLL